MIEHLHDREKALEAFGWKGREAEWIALVCLHSGVFTRAQFCFYFEGARRNRASRFVRDLVGRGVAAEGRCPDAPGDRREPAEALGKLRPAGYHSAELAHHPGPDAADRLRRRARVGASPAPGPRP